jgi:DNA excision repair protein ERCC-6
VTSYEGLKALQTVLLPHPWDVAVLDEGQRIRNPDAEVTLLCKQLRTAARLVLTGKSALTAAVVTVLIETAAVVLLVE